PAARSRTGQGRYWVQRSSWCPSSSRFSQITRRIHPVAAPTLEARAHSGPSYTTLLDSTREASRFLAEVESTKSRGQYIDPQAGKTRFGDFAARWEAARVVEATTSAATRSALRARLLPYW